MATFGGRFGYAALKISLFDRVVDNGHAGGMYVAIDLDTGNLALEGMDEKGATHLVAQTESRLIAVNRLAEIDEVKNLGLPRSCVLPVSRYSWLGYRIDRRWSAYP